jgi:hypothetical protein
VRHLLWVGLTLIVVTLTAILVTQTARAEDEKGSLVGLPKRLNDFQVDPYLKVAAELQGLGQDKACDVLLKFAKIEGYEDQVVILCRILFVRKENGKFRRPLIGRPVFFGDTDFNHWPLEPIELINDVPFVITRGYILVGEAESPFDYLDYCRANCEWNPTRFGPKSKEQKEQALTKVLASSKWKTPLRDSEKEFLRRQIE